jgi:hypothetical protein
LFLRRDTRPSTSDEIENRHYRLNNFIYRNGDLYPTHGVGPIAKMLNINKGNRFISLVSMSSKARGLHEYAGQTLGPDHSQYDTVFGQGDITTTMIKCARGETVLLTHDCSLPRPYSRGQRVQGTKGLWMEDKNAVHFDDFDSVAWMAITALSADSIACGSAPVPFPDFTNGKWIRNRPVPDNYWTLDGIFEGKV